MVILDSIISFRMVKLSYACYDHHLSLNPNHIFVVIYMNEILFCFYIRRAKLLTNINYFKALIELGWHIKLSIISWIWNHSLSSRHLNPLEIKLIYLFYLNIKKRFLNSKLTILIPGLLIIFQIKLYNSALTWWCIYILHLPKLDIINSSETFENINLLN